MSQAELLYQITEQHQQIQVWQQENLSWLSFGDGLIQTAIDLDRPDYLPESFNRAMLAGVMFMPNLPNKVLLAGTGGGSTARYFAHRFPNIEGDAVELSSTVMDIAKDYFEFPVESNWQLHQADIRQYLGDCQHKYDLIIVDIAEDDHSPEWITSESFLTKCRQCLTPQGQISINLIAETDQHFLRNLAALRQAFDKQTICLSLSEHRNLVLMAFNYQRTVPLPEQQQLLTKQRQWQIEFNDFYQQMQRDNPVGSGFL